MVTADVMSSSDGIRTAIEDRDLVSIGALAGLGAGGVFLGQEIADQVLPFLIDTPDPSTPSELGMSALVKLLAAMLMGVVALRMGPMGASAIGVLTFGTLVSMGLDFIDILQRGSLPGMAPSGGSSSSAVTTKSTSAPTPTPTPTRVNTAPSRPSSPSSNGADVGSYR